VKGVLLKKKKNTKERIQIGKRFERLAFEVEL
jgi:hypothetical protein